MQTVLLAGYYGFGNLGDDLLAETMQSLLKSKFRVITLKKRSQFLTLLPRIDCLMFAGGSLFQDVSGRGFSLAYYAAWGLLAKLFGKRLFLVAQGIGPVKRPLNRLLLTLLLRKADFVSVRDSGSAAFLSGTLNFQAYQLANDLLFAGIVKSPQKARPEIVVNLRPSADFRPEQGVELLRDLRPHYVPLQNGVDYGALLSRKAVLAAIAGARLAAGMRLHFLELAVLFNVPAIGIAYDPKVAAFCRRLRLPYVELDRLALLPGLIAAELKKTARRKQRLKLALRREQAAARQAVQKLREALNG